MSHVKPIKFNACIHYSSSHNHNIFSMKSATILMFVMGLLLFQTVSAQPYSVGTTTITFFDAARNRNVPADIKYPANSAGSNVTVANGQFPTVVFGHGFQIGVGGYPNIWNTLVPLGYIVVMCNTETSLSPNHPTFAADLSFLVNAMLAENVLGTSLFFNKVAPKAAVMGHSMGGGAAHIAASLGNPNITTLVSLAAAETSGVSAIGVSSSITIPSLVIAATEDCVTPVGTNQIPMYQNIAATCKVYYEITGGAHCQFTNGAGVAFLCYFGEGVSCGSFGPFVSLSVQHQKMFDAMIPWLNTYLKGSCTAWTNDFQTLLNTGTGFTYQIADAGCSANLLQAYAGADQTVCGGTVVTLSATGGTGYAWNTGQNGPAIQVTPLQTTLYKVTVSNALGCSASDQVQVFVTPAPTANAGMDQTICAGQSATLSATGGSTYAWSNGQSGSTNVVSPSATTTYTVTVSDATTCTASDAVTVTVNNCSSGIIVSVKVMLQGAYNPATQLMNTTLRSLGLLPVSQPYASLPWLYLGTENVGSPQNFPLNTVDWVLLEARNPATGLILEQRAGLLLSNGQIVDADGVTPTGVRFTALAQNGEYFFVVRHRNHLAVMNRQPLLVPNISAPLDFTISGNELGSNQLVNLSGIVFGQFAGDTNANGVINLHDFNLFFLSNGSTGQYLGGDFDLDGDVDGSDFLIFRPNARVTGINDIRQ